MRTSLRWALLDSILVVSSSQNAGAQAPVRVGGEFQANTYTTNDQYAPAVSMDNDGDFVVVWHSDGQDGASSGIFARRYSSIGAVIGAPFQVNVYTTSAQTFARVALVADADFVVAWQSLGQDGNLGGVFARRYSSAGAALTGEIAVNSSTVDAQELPVVAAENDGDFAIAWQSAAQDGNGFGVFVRH